MVIIVLSLLSISYFQNVTSEYNISHRYLSSTNAFWLAEAGVEQALWELNNGAALWSGWSTGSSGEKLLQVSWANQGDFDITIENPASNNPTII